MYHHDSYNAEAGKNETKTGWPTITVTRPILVDTMIEGMREGVWRVNDANLIMEMKRLSEIVQVNRRQWVKAHLVDVRMIG
jgi:hypothetical protein